MDYSGKIALIADDDAYSSYLLSTLLSRVGLISLIAENGLQAVDICSKTPEISIVLMDISMPEMNGIDATIRIKKMNPSIIVVAQTAYSVFGDEQRAFNAGCDAYISKPIDKDELYNVIEQFLH